MNLRHVRRVALVPLLLTSQVQGAEVPTKSGIVKGTVTVAGKPAADVVVSLEGSRQKSPKPMFLPPNRRRP